jgi:hypothetical protein
LLIGPDRLEDDTGAAIQIGTKHFQYAGGREILIAFANCDLALNLITHRTNSAAGRACNPSLLTISTSLRMQFKAAARKALSCWWLELPQKHFLSSFKSLPSLESRLAKGRRCLPGIRSDANPAIFAGHRSSPERTPQRSRKVSEMPSYEEEWHACLKFRRGKGSHFHPILACRRVAGGWARTACSLW